MALVKWYAHKNGTPLLKEWFPMAGDAFYKAADVEAWLKAYQAFLQDFLEWNACIEKPGCPGVYHCDQCESLYQTDCTLEHDTDCTVLTAQRLLDALRGGA